MNSRDPSIEVCPKFDNGRLEALFEELRGQWWDEPEYEQLLRDTHLAIALVEAGRTLGDDVDPRVVDLITKSLQSR